MAKDVLNIDIHGFSRADRLKVLNHTPVRSSDTAAQSSVLEAFELNEGLGVLSSSDPYATSEKWNLSHGTREQAVEAFGKRLSEYGQNVPSGNV
jgi:hypothetical protein